MSLCPFTASISSNSCWCHPFCQGRVRKGTRYLWKFLQVYFSKLNHPLVIFLTQTSHIGKSFGHFLLAVMFAFISPLHISLFFPSYQTKRIFKIILNFASGSVTLMRLVCKNEFFSVKSRLSSDPQRNPMHCPPHPRHPPKITNDFKEIS